VRFNGSVSTIVYTSAAEVVATDAPARAYPLKPMMESEMRSPMKIAHISDSHPIVFHIYEGPPGFGGEPVAGTILTRRPRTSEIGWAG
jgi:hypothetical protein